MPGTAVNALKHGGTLASCAAVALCAVYVTKSAAQSDRQGSQPAGQAASSGDASPIYGVTIPAGYRNWQLISIGRLKTDKIDQLRAQLGNDIAIKALEEGKLPFPDGSIIAA